MNPAVAKTLGKMLHSVGAEGVCGLTARSPLENRLDETIGLMAINTPLAFLLYAQTPIEVPHVRTERRLNQAKRNWRISSVWVKSVVDNRFCGLAVSSSKSSDLASGMECRD